MKKIKELKQGDIIYVVEEDPRTNKILRKTVTECCLTSFRFWDDWIDSDELIHKKFDGVMECTNGKKFATRSNFQVIRGSTVDTLDSNTRISKKDFHANREYPAGIWPEEYETALESTNFLFFNHFHIFTDKKEAREYLKENTGENKSSSDSLLTKRELKRILKGSIAEAEEQMKKATKDKEHMAIHTCHTLFSILLKQL